MKVIFIGSGELGVPTLRKLIEKHSVIGVFAQPDRPAGRGYKLKAPPIKEEAEKLGLKIWQPEKIGSEEALKPIYESSPDVIVLAAYGQILSKKLLEIPRLGAVNLHASLLPKYRGAAPVHWAIINGEKITGATTFLMDEGLDTGDILLQREIFIQDEDTAGTLYDKLAELGADLVLETLEGLEKGTIKRKPQDHKAASYAPKLKKSNGQINWKRCSHDIFNLIRGTNPYPGAFTFFNELRLKVHKSKIVDQQLKGEPGEIVIFAKEGFIVKTKDGALELVEVQPEAKKRMSGMDFVRGYNLKLGHRLS